MEGREGGGIFLFFLSFRTKRKDFRREKVDGGQRGQTRVLPLYPFLAEEEEGEKKRGRGGGGGGERSKNSIALPFSSRVNTPTHTTVRGEFFEGGKRSACKRPPFCPSSLSGINERRKKFQICERGRC